MPDTRESRDLLSIREAARRLCVHENTIRNYIASGRLQPVTLPSGVRRVPAEQIEAQIHRMREEMATQYAPATEQPEQQTGLLTADAALAIVAENQRLRGALLEIGSGHPAPHARAQRALREHPGGNES